MSSRIKYTLKQLTYFVVTAECGSFAESSKQLYVAQPAISSAISKLEDQFGTTLLLRHHAQGVTLTPSGRRLVSEARRLLRFAEEFQAKAGAEGQLIEGNIYLGSYNTIAPILVPPLISGFVTEHPNVTFKLKEGLKKHLVTWLQDGDIDLALLFDIDLPEGLEKSTLYQSIPHALLPLDHPLAKKSAVSLQELSREPFILLDHSPGRQYFTSLFSDRGLKLTITQKASSLEVLRGMIGCGLGVSVLITKPPSDISYGGREIAALPISDAIDPISICIARLANMHEPKLISAFTRYCESSFNTDVIEKVLC